MSSLNESKENILENYMQAEETNLILNLADTIIK